MLYHIQLINKRTGRGGFFHVISDKHTLVENPCSVGVGAGL